MIFVNSSFYGIYRNLWEFIDYQYLFDVILAVGLIFKCFACEKKENFNVKSWLIDHKNEKTIDDERLGLMSFICEHWKKKPALRLWIMDVIGNVDPPRFSYDFIISKRIYDALKFIPFRKDIEGVETLQTPDITSQFGGDCDDLSILASSALRSVGIPTNWIIAKQGGSNHFDHVAVFLPSIGSVFDLTHPGKIFPLPLTTFKDFKIK